MTPLKSTLGALCVSGAALMATQAHAGLVFYTSEAAFLGASTTSLIDFEGIVGDTSANFYNPYVTGGVSFDQIGGGDVVIAGRLTGSGSPFDSALLATNNGNALSIDFTGAGTTTAAGGIFGDSNSAGSSAVFRVFGLGGSLLGQFSATVGDMGAGLAHTFFGWTATGADVITRIEYNMAGTFEAVDDIRYGRAGATSVPEPASIALLGLGLLGLGISRRRKA